MDAGFASWVGRGAALALGVLIVAGVVALGIAAAGVVLLVFVAVIVAAGLEPFVGWLRGHLPMGRGATILLVYGAFLAVVLGMTFVILPAALTQLERTLEALPPFFEEARRWSETLRPAGLARSVGALIDGAARTFRPSDATPSTGAVIQAGLTVAETITAVLTLLTVVYFWLTEHARLQRYSLAFFPKHRRKRARDVWNEVETRLGMWVRGQLILMGAIGIGTGVAYTLLGVPSALLLGLIAGLAEAVPIVGPLLGAIPAIIVAATVSPELALVVAGVYVVLQLIEGNVLVPIVMRNTTGISPFLVILSLLIGSAAGGFVGALLAVPIAAAGEVLIEGLQRREVPVAQDPTTATSGDAVAKKDDRTDAADSPDRGDSVPGGRRAGEGASGA